MASEHAVTFQEAIEIVESLPDDQQMTLAEIVRHRQIDRRRDALAASIQQAREEFARGEVRRGTVEELLLAEALA